MLTRRGFITALASALPLAVGCQGPPRVNGPLAADPDGLLDLAEGLTYRVLDRTGMPLSDGYQVPEEPDGMACFARAGRWVLMRNHEVRPWGVPQMGVPRALTYDALTHGSVCRLVLDPQTLEVVSSNLVLTGTLYNCAGGICPQGWLSCEETEEVGHGWVFLCDPDAASLQAPVRIDAYGRFRHEAAAFDPRTGICVLTEDQPDSCLYRFVPDNPEDPFGDGRFQALVVDGAPDALTGTWSVGERHPVRWVTLEDPTAGALVRVQAHRQGAARFERGEGAWLEDGVVVFTATEGGPLRLGQIFALDLDDDSLVVLASATDPDTLNYPDNVTVDGSGRIYITEDATSPCVLHLLGPDGVLHTVARSRNAADELAGACLSPDGNVLFVSLMRSGATVAISGVGAFADALYPRITPS